MQAISEIIGYLLSPTITIAFLLGVGYLARDTISSYFASRVELNIKRELVQLESKLRDSESSSQAFRQFALAGLSKREDLLVEKKIQAVEAVWKDAVSLQKHRYLVEALKILNFANVDANIERSDCQDFVKTITPNLAPEKL